MADRYKPRTRRKRRRKGRLKKGVYKGMRLDSGWELAFVLWCEDHGKTIIRNTAKFPYRYRNRQYNWIPDFIVDGTFVEVKGRENQRTAAKFRDFKLPLMILRKPEITPILKYVTDKHGPDFAKKFYE